MGPGTSDVKLCKQLLRSIELFWPCLVLKWLEVRKLLLIVAVLARKQRKVSSLCLTNKSSSIVESILAGYFIHSEVVGLAFQIVDILINELCHIIVHRLPLNISNLS